MSDNPSIVHFPFRRGYTKRGEPGLLIPPVPHEFVPLIGMVIVSWSFLEETLLAITDAIVDHAGKYDKSYTKLSFRDKMRKLLQELTILLADKHEQQNLVNELIPYCVSMYDHRNTFAHGRYSVAFPKEGPAQLHIYTTVRRKEYDAAYNVDFLDYLYHEMAKVHGFVRAIFADGRAVPPLSSHDALLLQGICGPRLNRLRSPTPERRQRSFLLSLVPNN